MSLTLITDRSQTDVDNLKALIKKGVAGMSESELAVYNAGGHKGGYDYMDYNRVGAAIQELAGILNSYDYAVLVTARSDWSETETLGATARATYLSDLQTLKNAMYGTAVLPAAWEYLTFEEANNAELLLLQVEKNIYLMLSSFIFCGETHCGEV